MMNSGIMVYHHLFSGSFSTNLQRNYPLFHQEFQKKTNRTFSNPLPPPKTKPVGPHIILFRFGSVDWGVLSWQPGCQKVKFIFSFWRPNCQAGRRMAYCFPMCPDVLFESSHRRIHVLNVKITHKNKRTRFGDGKCSWMYYTQEQNCSIANGAI